MVVEQNASFRVVNSFDVNPPQPKTKYSENNRQTKRNKNTTSSTHGTASKGTRVASMLTSSMDFSSFSCETWGEGAAWVGLNTKFGPPDMVLVFFLVAL